MNTNIFAVVSTITAGYLQDQKQMTDNNISIGDKLEVDHIYIGRPSTEVLLNNFPNVRFNSVMFNFVDDDGRGINIFSIKHVLITDTYTNIFN